MNGYDFFLLASGVLFICMAISWFIFNYLFIPKIDGRIASDGKPRVCPVDIWGLRTLWIATAIAIPVGNPLNNDHNPFISPKAIRPYATKYDRIVARILFTSFYGFLLIILISYILYPEKYSWQHFSCNANKYSYKKQLEWNEIHTKVILSSLTWK